MRVLITLSQFLLGGSESYSVTVAEQLERLGHPTRLYAANASPAGRELAASRGLNLTVGEPPAALADIGEIDAVLAQDAASAYALAHHRPDLRQIFVIHGLAAFEHPAGVLRPVPPVVVLNDRTGAHAAALACGPEIVRLRQPIDLERYRPRGPSRERARRVLVLSNYLEADRLLMLEGVCADLGLELARVGGADGARVAPEEAIAAADIVVGYGRSVLEAMGLGRAAYVWDRAGGDGWVTPETYAAFEADGFSGAATGALVDASRLRTDFAAYRPQLGTCGFDLVRMHHSAAKHTEALVGQLEGAAAPASGDALETLALLVRAEARATIRAGGLEFESRSLREQLDRAHAAGAASAAAAARGAAAEARLEEIEGVLDTVLRSRSWRLTTPLRWAGSRLGRAPSRDS